MSVQQQNINQVLIDEICSVVGFSFEAQTIQSVLEENNVDFLSTIAALIQKYKGENKVPTFKPKINSSKSNSLAGETTKNEFTSIRRLDVFPNQIVFESNKDSAFMKTGLFEENKKSEEYKESSQKRKISYAPNVKGLSLTEDFIKEVRANFKKNSTSYNFNQVNKENPEKAKIGNKKKLLKIMAFRFMKNKKEENQNKEQHDRYENEESSPAESSLFSYPKKFENNSNMKTNKKNFNKNKDYNQKGNKSESFKNRNNNYDNNQIYKGNNYKDKENLNEQIPGKTIGIIDVEIEKFFNTNEKELNELSYQQKKNNYDKKNKAINLSEFNDSRLSKKNSNEIGQIGFNNNNLKNNYYQNQLSNNYYDKNNLSNTNQFKNNNFSNPVNNFRSQNFNSNINSNYHNINYNQMKPYGGDNYDNAYGLNNNKQVYFEGNYNNQNKNRNFKQTQQFEQGFNNWDNRTFHKGTNPNNFSNINNQNYEDSYGNNNGNKKNKIYKGKKY